MKQLSILLSIFLMTNFNANLDNYTTSPISRNEPNRQYIEGCIQEIGDTIFIVNDTKARLRSENISIEQELIVGKNYKIEYGMILESYPPILDITSYEEIEENYCE